MELACQRLFQRNIWFDIRPQLAIFEGQQIPDSLDGSKVQVGCWSPYPKTTPHFCPAKQSVDTFLPQNNPNKNYCLRKRRLCHHMDKKYKNFLFMSELIYGF